MKLSFSTRLFLAMLALCALAILAMGFASYVSFTRGFLGYLNEQAEERVSLILPRLEKAYAEAGTWDFLRERPNAWFFLTRPDDARSQPHEERPFGDRFSGGMPPRGMPFSGDMPPREDGPHGGGPPPDPSPSDLTGAFLRITLFDEEHRYVGGFHGYSAKEQILRPVMQNGHAVGWVGVTPFESVSAAGDRRFLDSQLRSSLLIGAVCLLLAAAAVWRISGSVLRPVRSVAEATRQLAAGDYSITVPAQGHDEIGQLASDFNRMAGQLAGNELRRREFMADISHELRTPLAIMRGELEAVEDGIRPLSPATVQSLQAEVSALSKLVDDVFELSLAEVGGPTYRQDPVDLSELLAHCMDAFMPRLRERHLGSLLEVPAGLRVRGDERRLSQIFCNLLENSLRYTDAGGKVWWHAVLEGEHIRVFCEDTAPGVPGPQQERLFERFYRVEASRSRASGGAGLGLAICRGIAAVHGGTMRATDSPLGGLCIEVCLPALKGIPA